MGCRKYRRFATAGPKPLIFTLSISNGSQQLLFGIATETGVEEPTKSALIFGTLIDVGDTQLWLPQERVIGAFKYLSLLGYRLNNGLERGAAIPVPKDARFDLGNHLLNPAADRAKILDSLLPKEPGQVCSVWIIFPSSEQRQEILWQVAFPLGSFADCTCEGKSNLPLRLGARAVDWPLRREVGAGRSLAHGLDLVVTEFRAENLLQLDLYTFAKILRRFRAAAPVARPGQRAPDSPRTRPNSPPRPPYLGQSPRRVVP